MLNKVLLIGRLGKDPENKYTAGGMQIVNFTIATSKKNKDQEKTQWHNITAFGKTAENCAKFLQKGSQVAIDGEIDYQSWEKDGEKKYKTVIITNNIIFLSGKTDGKNENGYQKSIPETNSSIPENKTENINTDTENYNEDDLPF